MRLVKSKPACADCGKMLSKRRYTRCNLCNLKHRYVATDTARKIGDALRGKKQPYRTKHPNVTITCETCGKLKVVSYYNRKHRFCSRRCQTTGIWTEDLRTKQALRGGTNWGGRSRVGVYKGIHFQSSWELAYIVYHLEHGVRFDRNYHGFPYLFEKKRQLYYPDFIKQGVYEEVKAFDTDQFLAKIKYFPKTERLKVLYRKDVKPYIDYCIQKYGKKFVEVLNPKAPAGRTKDL